MSAVLRDAHGVVVDREGSILLGRGGEARVWGLPRSGEALKILEPSARTPERLAGLAHLVARPRPRMLGVRDETPWGWPERLVFEDDACVGYTMRWFKKRKTLFSVVCPTERVRAFPAFDSRYVHRVGANLAGAVACLHDAGIVVGDLSESNVLVASDATVALVDVDSYQFDDEDGRMHPCPVGKPEFLPPEHHGEFFAETPKSPESDAFALAVLLFQMLFDGPHPFSGVHRGAGTPPTIGEAIVSGDYVFAAASAVGPRLGMPGPGAVSEEVRAAFARTFVDGLHRPKLRTSARAWATLLARAESDLVRCASVPAHRHPRGARCAWCERRSTFGRAFETFTAAPEIPSEAIALPVASLEHGPHTQRPLPRVADDESPLPPTVVALPPAPPPGEGPSPLEDLAHDDVARARRNARHPRTRRAFTARRAPRARPIAAGAPHPNAPFAEPDTEPHPLRPPEDPPRRARPAASTSPVPAPAPASASREAPTRPRGLDARAPSPVAAPRLGLRHALAAVAVLCAAFALGRSSATSYPPPSPIALATPTPSPEVNATTSPASAAVEGPRGSAVLRREPRTAEKKTPRPSR
jgi:serine/threonine protein kinase